MAIGSLAAEVGRSDRADQPEYPVLADEGLGVGDRRLWFVAVVAGDELDLPAMDAAGGVGFAEGREDAPLHLEAELRRRAGEGGRLPEQDATGRDALFRRRGGQKRRAGCGEDRDDRRETAMDQFTHPLACCDPPTRGADPASLYAST